MNTLLFFALVVSLLALVITLWLHLSLKNKLKQYTQMLQNTARAEGEQGRLDADFPGLEELSSAVHAVQSNNARQLTALASQAARLEATLAQMTDGVLITDAQGKILMANPAAEKLFGEGEPLTGKTISMALRHHQLIEAWRKCQQSGEMQSDSAELTSTRKFLQLIVIPDRHASGFILLAQDLTRIRRLETVRRDFISNVSHEFRTPLASLKALTETLQDGALEDPEAAQRFLSRIHTELDALTQMSTELLELARIESGQVPIELKQVQPCALLSSAVERMRTQAERAGQTLTAECQDDLPEILADAPRLQQVLVNLMHNAIKFTPSGGEIHAQAARDGHYVRFSVRDTGPGIPADDLTRIFERFYRVDRARSGGGTGLGLSIARHLVEAHGGRIWAESREGEGSTFLFLIPGA